MKHVCRVLVRWCRCSMKCSAGQPNLDTYFRRKWGTRKPIFGGGLTGPEIVSPQWRSWHEGLEDISVECQARCLEFPSSQSSRQSHCKAFQGHTVQEDEELAECLRTHRGRSARFPLSSVEVDGCAPHTGVGEKGECHRGGPVGLSRKRRG